MRRPPPPPALVLAAALGGLLGALGRWGLGELFPESAGFGWTTFAINVSGSFALALLPALAAVRRHAVLPVFLGTGVLGGYTTLSTYAEQGRVLLAAGDVTLAGLHLGGTLLACVAGVLLAHRWSTAADQREFETEEGNE